MINENNGTIIEYEADMAQFEEFIKKNKDINKDFTKYDIDSRDDKNRRFQLLVYWRQIDESIAKTLYTGKTTIEESYGFKGKNKKGEEGHWGGEQEILWLPISIINTDTGDIESGPYSEEYVFKDWQLPFIKYLKKTMMEEEPK